MLLYGHITGVIHHINGMMTDVYEGVHGHWGYFKDSWMADSADGLFHGESHDMANLGVHPIQETSICSDSFELRSHRSE